MLRWSRRFCCQVSIVIGLVPKKAPHSKRTPRTELSLDKVLLRLQRHERINFRCATSRDEARKQRDGDQYQARD